jgi:hypothetical protein
LAYHPGRHDKDLAGRNAKGLASPCRRLLRISQALVTSAGICTPTVDHNGLDRLTRRKNPSIVEHRCRLNTIGGKHRSGRTRFLGRDKRQI